jgi:hypothetical protein
MWHLTSWVNYMLNNYEAIMAKDMCWKVVSQRLTTYHGGSLHWKILIGLRRKEVLAGGWPGGDATFIEVEGLGWRVGGQPKTI